MSREFAVLIAAFLGGFLAQSHRIFELFFVVRQRRARARSAVMSDVKAMVQITSVEELNKALKNYSMTESSTLPLVVDKSLPLDFSQGLMAENPLAFSPEEIGILTAFYRFAKASRSALLAMTEMGTPENQKNLLISMAESNWSRALDEANKLEAISK